MCCVVFFDTWREYSFTVDVYKQWNDISLVSKVKVVELCLIVSIMINAPRKRQIKVWLWYLMKWIEQLQPSSFSSLLLSIINVRPTSPPFLTYYSLNFNVSLLNVSKSLRFLLSFSMGNRLICMTKKDPKQSHGSASKRLGRSQRKLLADEEFLHKQALSMAIHQQLSQRFEGSMSRRLGSTSSRRRNPSDSATSAKQVGAFSFFILRLDL